MSVKDNIINLQHDEASGEQLLMFLELFNSELNLRKFLAQFSTFIEGNLEHESPVTDAFMLAEITFQASHLNASSLKTEVMITAFKHLLQHQNTHSEWSQVEFNRQLIRKWINQQIAPDHGVAISLLNDIAASVNDFDINYVSPNVASIYELAIGSMLQFTDTHLKQLLEMGIDVHKSSRGNPFSMVSLHDDYLLGKLRLIIEAGADPFHEYEENGVGSFYHLASVKRASFKEKGQARLYNEVGEALDLLNRLKLARDSMDNLSANSSSQVYDRRVRRVI